MTLTSFRASELWQRLSLRDGETAVQVALGVGFVGAALVLWGEGSTFAISDSYSWFQVHVREDTAAWVLFVPGVAALAAPLFSCRWLSVAVAFALGTVAGMVALGFWLGSALSIGAVIFTSPICFLSYWLMIRRLVRP